MSVEEMLVENARRTAPDLFDPLTGQCSTGERFELCVSDYPLQRMWLPTTMQSVPIVQKLIAKGSFKAVIEPTTACTDTLLGQVQEAFTRIRYMHDFPYWAATTAHIKPKGGGADILFRLNQPQRTLIDAFERQRIDGKPIRVILLKARQWGGSTATQVYMCWLQLVQAVGLNSLIVGHVRDSSVEVKNMFDRLIGQYPGQLLGDMSGNAPAEVEVAGVDGSPNVKSIPARSCKIKIGTAERPDSARGGDYNLVHCTEVGMWKTTEGKSPADIVRSATSGVLLAPMTMIVYESTANGTGNFFAEEWQAAIDGESQFTPLFIPWYSIENYALPVDDEAAFAAQLLAGKDNEQTDSGRAEPPAYLWHLWESGASLQAIRWYVEERKKYSGHGEMAAEYPTDAVEAFVHSGAHVFDTYAVERMRATCKAPAYSGEVTGRQRTGKDALTGVHFTRDENGALKIWTPPDVVEGEKVTDRYLAVVDIGGRGRTADWSVIAVFDRIGMMDGEPPIIAAQWRGHIDMDILAWKAAQIATYYDNALLVIESNTIETHDKERDVDGDHSQYLLNQIADVYPNMYARKQSEDAIAQGAPKRYGFHTNTLTKPMVIDTLIQSVRDGLYTERDSRALDELLTYERKQNGSYGAIIGKHDDMLMTRAIGLHICFSEMALPVVTHPDEAMRNIKRHRRLTEVTEAMI